MPTDFPDAVDNLTNPDPAIHELNSGPVLHSAQHANANDAIEAIEAHLLGGAYPEASAVVLKSIVDAKGDLLVGTAADTLARLAADANGGKFLFSDPSTAEGVKWAFLSAAGYVVNVKDFAATSAQRAVVGSGVSKPLSGYYGTLAAAQAAFPHVTALTQELDWAVIQAAINSTTAGTIYFPAGTYICPGITWKTQLLGVGAGYTATVLKTLGGNLINMAGTLVGFHNIGFDATGGHIFNQVGSVSRGLLHTVRMHQRSADKCLWESNGLLYIDMMVFNFDTIIHAANTAPGWNFVGSGGNVNQNTWQKGRHTNSGGAPVFYVNSTHASTYYYDNVWRDINFEVVVGGGIWLGGNLGAKAEDCVIWDTTNATADFISFGAGTGGLASVNGTFKNVGRRASTFSAGSYCWGTRATSGTLGCHFEKCTGTSGGAPFTVNLSGTKGHTAIRGTWDSFTGTGVTFLGTRDAGWAAATGTATKTTFDTATVTTAQLAERVKALTDFLISRGDVGA